MNAVPKAGIAAVMGALVVAGSALGGSLLTAGAATQGGTSATPSTGTFHSNEAKPHETGEDPARESAETNGTARPAGAPDAAGAPEGAFHPNENGTHETSEDPAREQAEHNGAARPGTAAPQSSGPSSSGI